MDRAPQRDPVHIIATHCAISATFFGLGWALVNTHPYPGIALMTFGVLYLIYELFTSPVLVKEASGMLRFLAVIMVLAVLAGVSIPRLPFYTARHPNTGVAIVDGNSNSAKPPELSKPGKGSEVDEQILHKLDDIQRKLGTKTGNPLPMFVATSFVSFGKDSSTPLFISCDTMYGPTISPVRFAVFVGLVNNHDFATVIKSYKAESRDPRGKWVTLTTIGTIAAKIWMGYPQGTSVNDSKFFDRQIYNHALQPNEPVIGWMLFDYPRGWGGLGAPVRITVTDISGSSSTINPFKNAPNDIQGSNLIETGDPVNLSRFRKRDYEQRWNN